MKKLLFLAIAFCAMMTAQGQTSFSCTERATCLLDDNMEVIDCIHREEASLFVINSAETMITHTTDETKTTYYVKARDVEDDTFTYTVKSDTGNDYIFHFDTSDMTVMALYTDEDADVWAVRFKVKAIF